jgi:transcriptional regulator with XRE-family HTH domain
MRGVFFRSLFFLFWSPRVQNRSWPLLQRLTVAHIDCKLTGDNIMKPLGERIRELRERQDLSVRDLAKMIKVSAPFMSDVELGRRHPSDEVLTTIAAALGTTLEDLKKHDARPPIEALKRIAANNPAMGFALRRVVDEGVSPDELLEFLKRHDRAKKR